MRRIARWTIGRTASEAVRSLTLSIKLWRKIYGRLFDVIVCYNEDKPQVKEILLNQQDFKESLLVAPTTTAWKLYPPRIDMEAYEVFIDNDLIVYSPLSVVETFLSSQEMFFITAAWKRSYGGNDHLVPHNFIVNSGLFGLPPRFDFRSALCSNIKPWASHFDEQGLVASVLCHRNTAVIPLSDIRVCVPEESYSPARCGMHFVGLNNDYSEHWQQFLLANVL